VFGPTGMDRLQLRGLACVVDVPDQKLWSTGGDPLWRSGRRCLSALPSARIRQPARLRLAPIVAPGAFGSNKAWWFRKPRGAATREAKTHALANVLQAVPSGRNAGSDSLRRHSEPAEVASVASFTSFSRRRGRCNLFPGTCKFSNCGVHFL
jgi:hypothetical protein